jgi:hypothetical protein
MRVLPPAVKHSLRSVVARRAESSIDPISEFHSWDYLRHNQRRQEHLASLGLPIAERSVIETGAGIGDHTTFFLDRGCRVVTTEGRPENFEILRRRFPSLDVRLLDLDRPDPGFVERAEIVYCYGTLYHLQRPAEALAYLAARCTGLLLLETCVSPGAGASVVLRDDRQEIPSQAISGTGCRPTRAWVHGQLSLSFPHVYVTLTQPWHPEFPLDWTIERDPNAVVRAVFVASREPLDNPALSEEIPDRQVRH